MDDLTPKTPAELGLDLDLVDEAMDILNPFEKLVPVQVLEKIVYLPENNSMWRGLQFWGLVKGEVTIDFGLFCIAGTCRNCKALVKMPAADDREPMLLCQTKAEAGAEIRKLPNGFRLKTRSW